jgi:hypothetical protein
MAANTRGIDRSLVGLAEVEAVLRHSTFRMASKYRSQRPRAKGAIAKVEAAE